jgi:hypothetical protein
MHDLSDAALQANVIFFKELAKKNHHLAATFNHTANKYLEKLNDRRTVKAEDYQSRQDHR